MENVKVVKVTKREVFGEMVEIFKELGRNDLVEFATHEIELLDKKANNRKTSATATQKANVEIKEKLVEELKALGKAVTVSEFMKESEIASQYSNQKLSALLNQLVNVDKVVNKTTEKRKSYFSVA